LFSYPKETIVARAKKAVRDGVREIWVTAQDTGAYGKEIGTDLADLLEEICGVEGKFFVRIGMMNPNHALRMLDKLVEVYKNEKVFKFLHLPVQSGDNEVLRLMNRFYSVEDFKKIVRSFRREFPRITIATDVICGFPGETRKAFEKTLELVEEVKPDIVNVSKFFARPKTVAAQMREKFLSPQEIKSRSGEMARLARRVALERNKGWVGWTGEVLIDERGKIPDSWVGRNFAYKPIVIKNVGSGDLLGKTLRVMVVKAFTTYLEGEVVE
jgi:MiaB/RimO family radical SAM methylthiotransferase